MNLEPGFLNLDIDNTSKLEERYIGVTDNDWFAFLSKIQLPEQVK